MKNIKKHIALVLSLFIVSSGVYAANITDVSFDMGTIKVAGTAEKEDGLKLVITNYSAGKNDVSGLLAVKEFKSSADGTFQADVNIADSLVGENSLEKIVLSVKDNTGTKDKKTLDFAKKSEMTSLVSEINTNGSIDEFFLDETKADKKRVLKAIGFSVEGLENLSPEAQTNMLEMYERKMNLSSANGSDMAAEFNKMLGLGYINDSQDYGFSLLGAEFNGVKYVNITDAGKKAFIDRYIYSMPDYTDYAGFYSAYDEANALYEINKAMSSSLFDLIKDYSGILDVADTEAYRKLVNLNDSYKVGIVIDNMIKAVNSKELTTKAEFKSLLEAEVNKVSISSGSTDMGIEVGGTSSFGGGGGGSSFGGGSTGGGSGVPSAPVADGTNAGNIGGFKDVDKNHWAYEPIVVLNRKRVINGYEDGSFKPEDFVTRAEFIKMIITATGKIDQNAVCDFTDVYRDDWFRGAVATGYKNGLITGDGGQFRPYDNISRQEAVTIIYRQFKNSGKSCDKIRENNNFADESQIMDYAKEAVAVLYQGGIINGVSEKEFMPADECTRAQAAQLIYNAFCK